MLRKVYLLLLKRKSKILSIVRLRDFCLHYADQGLLIVLLSPHKMLKVTEIAIPVCLIPEASLSIHHPDNNYDILFLSQGSGYLPELSEKRPDFFSKVCHLVTV